MTLSSTNSPFECDGAQIRAQCRHLAIVVTISGDLNDLNIDRVSQHIRRFILADKPVILDLSRVDSFSPQCISLLYAVDEGCDTAEVEWFLIAPQPVLRVLRTSDEQDGFPTAASVPAALHQIADILGARRRLLPLLSKTA